MFYRVYKGVWGMAEDNLEAPFKSSDGQGGWIGLEMLPTRGEDRSVGTYLPTYLWFCNALTGRREEPPGS